MKKLLFSLILACIISIGLVNAVIPTSVTLVSPANNSIVPSMRNINLTAYAITNTTPLGLRFYRGNSYSSNDMSNNINSITVSGVTGTYPDLAELNNSRALLVDNDFSAQNPLFFSTQYITSGDYIRVNYNYTIPNNWQVNDFRFIASHFAFCERDESNNYLKADGIIECWNYNTSAWDIIYNQTYPCNTIGSSSVSSAIVPFPGNCLYNNITLIRTTQTFYKQYINSHFVVEGDYTEFYFNTYRPNSISALCDYSNVANNTNVSCYYNETIDNQTINWFVNAYTIDGGILSGVNNFNTTSINYSAYNVIFPYENNAYTTNNTLTYGFNTTDPYYDYTRYNINLVAYPEPLIDYQENADSVAVIIENLENGTLYENYTKPTTYNWINDVVWRVRHGGPEYNITLPSGCQAQSPIQVKIVSQAGYNIFGSASQPFCYNGTAWQAVGNYRFSSGFFSNCGNVGYETRAYDGDWNTETSHCYNGYWYYTNDNGASIYEDGIYWLHDGPLSVETTNTTIKFDNLNDGKYYYALTVYDIYGNSAYLDPNVTIDTTVPVINFSTGTTPNGSYLADNSIFVNLSIIEENVNITSIYLYNDIGALISSINNDFITNLTEGVVGNWHFDSNYSDSLGAHNSTNDGGAVFIPGKFGDAINFTGTAGSSLVIPYFNITNHNTICAWMRTQNEALILGQGVAANLRAHLVTYNTFAVAYSQMNFPPYNSAPYVIYYPENITASDNSWHLICWLNNNNETLKAKLYIDGIYIGQNASTVTFPWLQGDYWLGKYLESNGVIYNYAYSMDELTIWNRILNQNEIITLYNNGLGITYPYNNDPYNINAYFTNLPRGKYYFNATVTDLVGYSASTDTWEANIVGGFATGEYNVTVKYPTGTYTNDTTYYIIGNTTDAYFILWNITLNTQNNISNQQNYREDYSGLSDGLKEINITATDLALNTYLWQTHYTVDTTAPVINFSTGTTPNGSVINVDNIFVNLSIIEENINVTTINLYDSGGLYSQTTLGICYQEFANESNGCGIDTGTYEMQILDDIYAGIYINYTIPAGASHDSLWQVKYSILGVTNLSIPENCWYSNILQLRELSAASMGRRPILSCYNGTDYEDIVSEVYAGGGAQVRFASSYLLAIDGDYNTGVCFWSNSTTGWSVGGTPQCDEAMLWEEGMLWIIKNDINFTNLPNGQYYFNATATDLIGYSASTDTWGVYVLSNFSTNFYNVTFPYPNEYYLNQSTLTYGFSTIDPYYDYASYYISAYNGYPFAAASCFQESFNTSNQTGIDGPCTLNYTGTSNVPAVFNDGDYSSAFTVDNNMTYYINYTLPSATNLTVIWQIKEQHVYPYKGGGEFTLQVG